MSARDNLLRFFLAMDHCGIGGGGYMLVRSSNGLYEFIDFREAAPAAAFQDMYNEDANKSIFGGLARYSRLTALGAQHQLKLIVSAVVFLAS